MAHVNGWHHVPKHRSLYGMLVAGVHVHVRCDCIDFSPHTAVGATPRAENVKCVVCECRATLWKDIPTYKKKTCASNAWVGVAVGTTPQVINHIINTGPPPLALGDSNHIYTFGIP